MNHTNTGECYITYEYYEKDNTMFNQTFIMNDPDIEIIQ